MYKIVVKGDLRGKVDPRLLEGFLTQYVQDASGAPVARVTFHGLVRNRAEDVVEAMSQQQGGAPRR